MFDAFQAPQAIGLVFAAVAAPMALASWANSRFVGRFGLRRVGHGGAAAFALVTLVHALIAASGYETLAVFIVLQGLAMACFAFTSSNLGDPGDGAYGADRRHRLVGPGRRRARSAGR